ncbi:MAG: substrate-binding domain-containing protein [Planctomycetes bacterium]|nr:substrate-binding domain-containing protein [Planctomycetota bacterium]
MNQFTTVSCCLLLLAAACGDHGPAAVLASGDGKWRVVHVAEAQWKGDRGRAEMEAALERLAQIDLVYAHNDPMAFGAATAARQKGRTGIRFVGIDALPDEGRKYVADGALDATIEYPTLAAEAIDLALLAANGIELARQYTFGTRVWTRTNLAAGGTPIASPATTMLVALRREHAAILTTEPKTDQIFKIGMAQCTDDEPWRAAMRTDMQAWARRYPQVEFHYRAADDDTEKQRGCVRDFVAQGCHAIIVSPKESLALAAACKEALAAGIRVIVLDRELGSDDYTTFLGSDNVAIGREAGMVIRELLPAGGTIVELQGLMTSSPAQQRHQGFVEALGLAAPK